LDLAAFFSPALRFKRLVFAHTHLLHKESLPTDFAGHFPPPSYSLEPHALFTCAHGIAIALFSTVPGQSRTKVVVLYAEPLRHSTRKRVSDSCCRSQSSSSVESQHAKPHVSGYNQKVGRFFLAGQYFRKSGSPR
jgi:hypothetical protein